MIVKGSEGTPCGVEKTVYCLYTNVHVRLRICHSQIGVIRFSVFFLLDIFTCGRGKDKGEHDLLVLEISSDEDCNSEMDIIFSRNCDLGMLSSSLYTRE